MSWHDVAEADVERSVTLADLDPYELRSKWEKLDQFPSGWMVDARKLVRYESLQSIVHWRTAEAAALTSKMS